MTVSERDIEKMRDIGYHVDEEHLGDGDKVAIADRGYHGMPATIMANGDDDVADAWASCKAHAQSPEGMKATMADKVRWLHERWNYAIESSRHHGRFRFGDGEGDSPESAVDALFWKVP